ncbi:hypothetical protein NM688_g2878 [Phlebia brevispora]|uniref:Uncharacterized protein n=1 Tax=Phlebia brevispora TaxID=194682 RepID=A0ACC1T7J5_9APHY|nr:hypothetical protein NM688_g2878 [Phlebia brevispora]
MKYALTLLALAAPCFAAVQELWWNITYVQNANPDGLADRRAIGINGVWPPPSIDITTNDTLVIHSVNLLDQVSTLHCHGLSFNSTPWMDGAQGVGQCGIPPNATFDYTIPVEKFNQWGTYWIHSHSLGQYVDGLRSPIVVHPPVEKYQYDEEFTIVLGDWYHQEHAVLMQQYISVANPGGAEPVPDSGLIYFAQGSNYLGPIAGTHPGSSTAATGFNENATLPFQPGKTYRLRILNAAAFSTFYFWIDGHDMRLIEGDGLDVEATPVNMLSVTAAQRYSVLVTARNDTSANWVIHANMDTGMFDSVPPTLNPNITSSITYDPSAPLKDLGTVDSYVDLADQNLVPLDVLPMLPATRTIPLEVSFDTMTDGTNRAMFNGKVFSIPMVPAIMSAVSLGSNATIPAGYGPFSFVLDHFEVVDILIQNSDTGKHPFHMHGHKMQIVQRSTDYTSNDTTLNPPIVEGQANPMRRDTVQVPGGGGVTLRVVADNPGVWIFHCHIEWHLQAGLGVTFIEAPLALQEFQQIPQFMYDQCQAQGLPSSGNAAGHTTIDDYSGWTLGPYAQVLGWHSKGIGAMAGSVLTAVIGMMTVTWYSLGGHISEEEMEEEARVEQEAKEKRGKFFGFAAGDWAAYSVKARMSLGVERTANPKEPRQVYHKGDRRADGYFTIQHRHALHASRTAVRSFTVVCSGSAARSFARPSFSKMEALRLGVFAATPNRSFSTNLPRYTPLAANLKHEDSHDATSSDRKAANKSSSLTKEDSASTVPSPPKGKLTGDWVLFHPVYTPEEVRAVEVMHRDTKTVQDKLAATAVHVARKCFDWISGYKHRPIPPGSHMDVNTLRQGGYILDDKQWLARILFLESIAAVPGMVGATLRHLRSLRLMRRDSGWIHTLLEEAENERMHLMTFMTLRKPPLWFRGLVILAQGVFYNAFFLTYLFSPKICHRFVGYLEEEAIVTYTKCIEDMEAGRIPEWTDKAAPAIAKDYWRLAPDATMLDLIYAVRSDETTHRFVNHSLANLNQKTDVNPFALREPDMFVKGTKLAFERSESAEYLQESQKLLESGPETKEQEEKQH